MRKTVLLIFVVLLVGCGKQGAVPQVDPQVQAQALLNEKSDVDAQITALSREARAIRDELLNRDTLGRTRAFFDVETDKLREQKQDKDSLITTLSSQSDKLRWGIEALGVYPYGYENRLSRFGHESYEDYANKK